MKRLPTQFCCTTLLLWSWISSSAALAQAPNISGLFNGPSATITFCPGVLVVVTGSNLADGPCTPTTQPAPATLCGASITVAGKSAAMLLTTTTELRAQLPVDAPLGPTTLVVERQGLRSGPIDLTLDAFAPGLFFQQGNIGGISKQNGSQVSAQNPASLGERLILLADGLGPTNPPVATGMTAPFGAATTTRPSLTVGGQPATIESSELSVSLVGTYLVIFTVPANLPAGTHLVVLQIGGKTGNTVLLPVTTVGVPQISAVVNGASFAAEPVAAPGSILSIFGSQFGLRDNLTAFPNTEFDGLTVTMNATRTPLFAVSASSNQINVLAPTELPELGFVPIQVRTAIGGSTPFSVTMVSAAPGIFRVPDPSNPTRRNAAALFANTAWLALPASMARALGIPDNCGGVSPRSICGQPAAAGDVLQVFVTGLGKATPGGDPNGRPLVTGSVAPPDGNPLYLTLASPSVTIADVPAPVLFSGLAPGFAGLYQINVRVPAGVPAGDDVAVRISMPNGRSDVATIAIRR